MDAQDTLLNQAGAAGSTLTTAVATFPSSTPTQTLAQEPVRRTPARPKRTPHFNTTVVSSGMYWVFEVMVAVGLMAIAGLLWYWDGAFTISFIAKQSTAFAQWGIWQWTIPVFFTAVTLGAWPRKEIRTRSHELRAKWGDTHADADYERYESIRKEIRVRWAMVSIVVLVNIGTSFSGLVLWLANRTVDLFLGWTFPDTGWGLYAPATVIGIILAFGPEKIGRWAMSQLMKLFGQL
ncbi:hypothetical protein [Herpetosiphon gulosus]|uniref:Uncharacterized protein n=1 Tax=Herpetosiphon gulosus TaxID=1973496 RepID=A0ABP9X825_9CHLR